MIQQAVVWLKSKQLPGGSFTAWSSPRVRPFTPSLRQPCIFQTILIAQAIQDIPELHLAHQRAVDFVAGQQQPSGSWTYWLAEAAKQQTEPYPPDLDDTACAVALQASNYLSSPEKMAQLARLLTSAEQAPGGPYNTWLCDWRTQQSWHDIDPAVNANIAFMLRNLDIQLSGLTQYLDGIIKAGSYKSSYYVGAAPLLYFLARAGIESVQPLLERELRAEHRHRSSLETALLLSAGCFAKVEKALLSPLHHRLTRKPRQFWPAAAFYVDPVYGGQQHYGGSSALTTAFVLEALHKYEQLEYLPVAAQAPVRLLPKSEIAAITSPALRRRYRQAIKEVAESPQGTAIAHAANSMAQVARYDLPPKMCQSLNLGSLHGWLAYTLYDNIIDGDSSAKNLPLANIALRRSYDHFLNAFPDADWKQLVRQTFDKMDMANDWEVHNARCGLVVRKLPDYKELQILAQRSMGHSLAARGVLLAAGYPLEHNVQKQITAFFHNFIIARQLNDDAHDWEQDLAAGRITPIVVWLLQKEPLPAAAQSTTRLQQKFWHDTIDVVHTTVKTHILAANEALSNLPSTFDTRTLGGWLTEIQLATKLAVKSRNQAREFIATFEQGGI